MFLSNHGDAMNPLEKKEIFGTDELLVGLCGSVTKVLTLATDSPIRYSAMVQRISKTCLKPDIGCFVLLDGGFSGLAILNFSAQAAMELYERYMLNMGIPKDSVIEYEAAVRADGFLVMAHGEADDIARAKTILTEASASRVDVHLATEATVAKAS